MDPISIAIDSGSVVWAFVVPLIVFLVIVAPIWIIAHYVTRRRAMKGLSDDDQQVLAELYGIADRLEGRMQTVERILDAESKDWRAEQ